MTYSQQLQAIIDTLTNSLQDAAKFDTGVDAAGRRVRSSAQEAKTKLQELRLAIQAERNSRKSNLS
tara:strand:+ start:122 stop:319 length:198 start_codon:yes stop_codon:yes gene_type:complete